MKKSIILAAALGLFCYGCAGGAQTSADSDVEKIKAPVESVALTKDGTFKGESDKDEHGGIIKVELTVAGGKITEAKVQNLNDQGKEKDEEYGRQAGSDGLYKQAQDSVAGTATYGPDLVEKQDINMVDAVSGATESHEKFVQAVQRALEAAK